MGTFPIFLVILALAGRTLQTGPVITAPQAGAILSGSVEIQGDIGASTFSPAELAFSFAGDPTGTWFLLQSLPGGAPTGLLATWDTSRVTDGDYRLRLQVVLDDGSVQEVIVEDLHIRNDSPPPLATQTLPVPTDTPEPAEDLPELVVPTQALQSTPEILPAQGPLPENPAGLNQRSVLSIFGRSVILVLVLFAVLGLLLRFRRN